MQDAGSSQAGGDQRKPRYDLMDKAELETLTVAAIREHRRLLAADQAVYEEWIRASEDPTIVSSVLETLQEEHFARQTRAAAQQDELSDMLDALGFVPEVPVDDDVS
ncbi:MULTISPECIES: transcriptional repressor TraM [Rhizobiaceae]|uniref:Transcriptional regulator n=2 Tax=Rhizobium tropici TaxID=398 RepID=A0A6P1C8Z4_RHITR|nr:MULTISPECIES: transcriptional repressor TraM [Rhizobiaceae]AEI89686.1 conjugal transfer transcriptional repressor traM protein [Sinorhizobium fredii GR64]AGB73299.1 conjugal transfer transcriptional regulator TraM [Rhizobium tropici CIAT 899]NEV11384.1 transcriptional regulator [Rhizobium tropici]TGE93417.1 transcriptional regulator [Rhizobium sp. SEMIA 4088]WOS67318.1 transcriptional repressor TraM [Sinorhizobium fredii GR64]